MESQKKGVIEKDQGHALFVSFTIRGEDGSEHLFIHDSGASDLVVLDTIPGKAFKASFINNQTIEVASGKQLDTSAFNLLLPLKSKYYGKSGEEYMLTRALTLGSIINELPEIFIGDLVDEAYLEYVIAEKEKNRYPLYQRYDLPSKYISVFHKI